MHEFYVSRLKELFDVITNFTETCAPACSCHQEAGFLRTLLNGLHDDAVKKRSALKNDPVYKEKPLYSDNMMLFEAYAGEVRYLRGMLRDCDGTTTNSIAVKVELWTTLGPKAVLM